MNERPSKQPHVSHIEDWMIELLEDDRPAGRIRAMMFNIDRSYREFFVRPN